MATANNFLLSIEVIEKLGNILSDIISKTTSRAGSGGGGGGGGACPPPPTQKMNLKHSNSCILRARGSEMPQC